MSAQPSAGAKPPPRVGSLPEGEPARGATLASDAWRRLRKNRTATASAVVLLALLVASILVPMVSSYRYDATDLALGAVPPSWAHWMGTDAMGRDLLVRLFFGGRISFAVGLVATIISFTIGCSWGATAGYFGKTVDAVMMRIVDVLYTFPFLILVIVLQVFFANQGGVLHRAFGSTVGVFIPEAREPSYFPVFQIVFVFAALGCISWLTMARIVRGQVLTLREQPFIEAARSLGVGHAAIIFRHLLPNALGPIIVYTTLTVPEIMLTEAFLSFLGLGTQEPLSSWGSLAAAGADALDVHPWTLLFPAATLALTLFAFNHLGDGLRDALDPQTHEGRS